MHLPDTVKVATLYRQGLSRAAVERLIRTDQYQRIGGGWLTTNRTPTDVATALRSGHRLSCLSAAKVHGLWVPPHTGGLHVYRTRHQREDAPAGLVLHRPEPLGWPDDSPVADLSLTLRHAAICRPTVEAAILFESAWNKQLIDQAGITDVLRHLPARRSVPLGRLRADAQSGTETRVRWWLEGLGVAVSSQVKIDGVGRVDLLVGRRWVIECDSREHHTAATSYANDRRRDLELRRLNYLVTRLTWSQVFIDWAATHRALQEILTRREHIRKPVIAA